MGQVLHGSATTTAAVRRAIQHSQESLRGLAKRYGVNPKTIAKWKSRKSVSIFGQDQRAQVDGPVSRGRGRRCRLPKAYFVAARRLPIRPATDRPASDALIPTPVSAAPRDLSAAAGRRRSLRQTQIQGLSDRLFSYRPRRSSNRAGQTLPHRRHRPNVEVRLRRVAREGGAPHRGGLPAPPDRRRPLQGPHGPH